MSPNRIKYWGLGTLALLMLAGAAARGQENELRGGQLFEPADVRPYDGDWARPKTGFFCSLDGIYWFMSAPKKTSIGDPGPSPIVFPDPTTPITESNSLDTGRYRATWKQGDRLEFGYVGEHHGILIGTLETNTLTENIAAANVSMVFTDPAFGPGGNLHYLAVNWGTSAVPNYLEAPVTFGHVSAVNRTKLIDGVEAMYIYRAGQLERGGTIEWMVGGRYFALDDTFSFDGIGGFMDETLFNNAVQNRVGGPQIGFRWYKPFGRFSLTAEGRFMAGVNTETVRQDGILASNITTNGVTGATSFGPPPRFVVAPVTAGNPLVPSLLNSIGFQHSAQFTEFVPLVEFRTDLHVKLTNLISFQAGWTTMWMNGIGRGADMIDYTVSTLNGPPMGINTTNVSHANRQDMLMYGFNIGLELNR
jgi:hypothetical protein